MNSIRITLELLSTDFHVAFKPNKSNELIEEFIYSVYNFSRESNLLIPNFEK